MSKGKEGDTRRVQFGSMGRDDNEGPPILKEQGNEEEDEEQGEGEDVEEEEEEEQEKVEVDIGPTTWEDVNLDEVNTRETMGNTVT
jgi:hypothetical protein